MEKPSSSLTAISDIPGEPAIVINGVPKLPSQTRRSAPPKSAAAAKAEAPGIACLGDWMGGREVRKLFGDQYYTGRVIQYDKETRWYRVVYEDGDFEDLEWHELHEILVPLDINIPLKALALKVISKGIDLNPQPNEPNEPPKEPNQSKEPPKEPNQPKETPKEPNQPKEPPKEPIEPKEQPNVPKELPKAPNEPKQLPKAPREPPKATKEPPKEPNKPKELPNAPVEPTKESNEPKMRIGRTTRSSAKKGRISM